MTATFEKPITYKAGGTVLHDDYSVGSYQVRVDQLEPWEAIIDLLATIAKLIIIWLATDIALPEFRLDWSLPQLPKIPIEKQRKAGILAIWLKHFITLGRLP